MFLGGYSIPNHNIHCGVMGKFSRLNPRTLTGGAVLEVTDPLEDGTLLKEMGH